MGTIVTLNDITTILPEIILSVGAMLLLVLQLEPRAHTLERFDDSIHGTPSQTRVSVEIAIKRLAGE